MFGSLAISLVPGWKILQSFVFLYPQTNIVGTLNLFNSLKSFNFFLIKDLVLISGNSVSKRFKISIL